MKNQLLLGAIALGVASFGLVTEKAQAFNLTACSTPGYVVTSATNCNYLAPLSGSANLLQDVTPNTNFSTDGAGAKINVNNVNVASEGGVEGFFGTTNWSFLGKKETGATSGSLSLSSLFSSPSSYDKILAVFKGGNGTTAIGYLLGNKTTFAWTASPYDQAPIGDGDVTCTSGCGISHINFYGVQGGGTPPTDVPTPAAVLPIIGGLFGAARRKKNASVEA